MEVVYQKPKRSAFLTILCFLTFIGSTHSIVKNVLAYRKATSFSEYANKEIEKSRTATGVKTEDAYANKMFEDTKALMAESTTKRLSIFMVIGNFLTLSGGILMFSLNRKGFYAYILGTLVIVVTPLWLYGGNSIPGLISAVAQSVIGVVFIAMYSFNLKDMTVQPVYRGEKQPPAF